MNILGIETSTDSCSVGFVNDLGVSLEHSLEDSHVHSEKLQTLIKHILEEAETTPDNLDAVAVSIGPGSFTGLRIGLSSAKGLCFALGKPLVTVGTFDAIAKAAFRAHNDVQDIVIVLDAKQSDFYVGRYGRIGEYVKANREVAVLSLDNCIREIERGRNTLVLTDAAHKIQGFFSGTFQCKPVQRYCRGDVIAFMGIQKCSAGQFSALASVEPLYLKDFVVKNINVSASI